jgi:PhnB protein
MAKRSLSEQLNQAIDALIVNDGAALPRDEEIVQLAGIAQKLKGLPREDFKKQLRETLKGITTMSAKAAPIFREGFHTITPYIIVNEAAELIEFVKDAFEGVEQFRTIGSAGGIHCEVRIGDSMVMIGGGGAWKGTPTPASLLVYVDDVDTVYENALKAGATSTNAPTEQEYGDRDAGVSDRFGNNWYITTRRPLEHNPPDLRTITPMQSFKGASQAIEFFKQAFGAEQVYRAESPDGNVVHAKIRIGDSLLALSEAHGPYQQSPRTFYLYVDDVDSWFARAVEAGAEPTTAPANQDYGDRVGGVTDPYGNTWYLGTPIRSGTL